MAATSITAAKEKVVASTGMTPVNPTATDRRGIGTRLPAWWFAGAAPFARL
ncbi:MAG: hypothetical protein Kow00114_22590 [Kiloniellaceae bacterium]